MKKIAINTSCKRLLADVFTPVGIYLRLRDRFRDTVLLESTDHHAAENSWSFIGINAIAGMEISSVNSIEFKLPAQKPERDEISGSKTIPELLFDFMNRFEVTGDCKEAKYAQGLYGYTTYDAVQFFDAIRLQTPDSKLPTPDYRLLIAGEFYEDKTQYTQLIEELGISKNLILRTDFIPDNEVKYYLSAADVVVQPYRNATQSGVTPLAYHFEKPMIVTNVGSLPDLVPNEKVGLVCEPDPASIAAAIERYFQLGENFFLPHLRNEKEKYSWGKLVEAIVGIVKGEK